MAGRGKVRLVSIFMIWSFEISDKTKSFFVFTVPLTAFVLGMTLLVVAAIRFFTAERGASLLVPAATLITVGATALTAAGGLKTWADERRQDRIRAEYHHREQVYGQIVQFMVGQHAGGTGSDIKKDLLLRTEAAVWASPNVVKALGDRISMITDIMGDAPGRSFSLNDEQQQAAHLSIGNVVMAMREDLGTDQENITVDEIIGSIFNRPTKTTTTTTQ